LRRLTVSQAPQIIAEPDSGQIEPVIASEAKQSSARNAFWIASAPFGRLAMTPVIQSDRDPL
jgi:hypothetical protein